MTPLGMDESRRYLAAATSPTRGESALDYCQVAMLVPSGTEPTGCFPRGFGWSVLNSRRVVTATPGGPGFEYWPAIVPARSGGPRGGGQTRIPGGSR